MSGISKEDRMWEYACGMAAGEDPFVGEVVLEPSVREVLLFSLHVRSALLVSSVRRSGGRLSTALPK